MSAAEIENTIEEQSLDQGELSQNLETYLSFDQRIEIEAQDRLGKQDRTEQRPEKFEALVSSVDEVIAREQFEAEQWTEVFDSSTRNEDSRLSRSADNPAWNYTNESDEVTSLTQSITEQADAIIASRHEEILQGLYSQGFATVEYYDELSQSMMKEFYFADEKGHISYKAFSKYEESPLADYADENLEGAFEIVDSSVEGTRPIEDLSDIVSEPLQIDLNEFFAAESQSYEQTTDPVHIDQEQRQETVITNLFTSPSFHLDTSRDNANLEPRADHPVEESIINPVSNLKEPIFLTFEDSSSEEIIVEELVLERQTEQPTTEIEILAQEQVVPSIKESPQKQLAPRIEQKTNSVRIPEQNLNTETTPAISIQSIEKSAPYQKSMEPSRPKETVEVSITPSINDFKESQGISIKPSEMIIFEEITNVQEPEKSLIKEIEEFDDLEIVQTAIMPEAITIKIEQSESAQIMAISRVEQMNIDLDLEIKSDAKEQVQEIKLSRTPQTKQAAQRIKFEPLKIERVLPIEQVRTEVKDDPEKLEVSEQSEVSHDNREGREKEVEQIVKIDQTEINTERVEKSAPLYKRDDRQEASQDNIRPLYMSESRQSSRTGDRKADAYSSRSTHPDRSTYNREALNGRNQPSYMNDTTQAEIAEVYLDNNTGISLAPLKTAQLELAA